MTIMKTINPFNKKPGSAVQYYEYNSKIENYKDFIIAYNHMGSWDVIKDGVTICQRVTEKGAKGFVDVIYSSPDNYFVQRALGFLENN